MWCAVGPRCCAGWRKMSPLSCRVAIDAGHRWIVKRSRWGTSKEKLSFWYETILAQKVNYKLWVTERQHRKSKSAKQTSPCNRAAAACPQTSQLLLRCFFRSRSISASPQGGLTEPKRLKDLINREPSLDFFCYCLSSSIFISISRKNTIKGFSFFFKEEKSSQAVRSRHQ